MNRNIQLVIPAAGLGSRFRNAGFLRPKPLIDVLGLPMISWVIGNFTLEPGDKVVVVGKAGDDLESHLSNSYPGLDVKFIEVDVLTSGPASTVQFAYKHLDPNLPFIVANSDQYISSGLYDFVNVVRNQEFDGVILTMEACGNKWSYVTRNTNGFINEVREKVEISNEATVGIYAWSRPSDFAQSLSEMIKSDDRVNGEFYVAPTYNYLIKNKMKIKPFHIGKVSDSVFGLGTPEDLEIFLETNLVLELRKSVTERLNQA
jgi:NDP-sugar pyrophosphorylase family protein